MPKATDTHRGVIRKTLTKKAFDVSGAVDDPENLNTIGERAVEDEIALEAFTGQARTEEKRGFLKLLCVPSSGMCAKA